MTHSKAALRKLSRAQLISTLMFLLAWMKVNNPEAYHAAERKAGLSKGRSSRGARRGKTSRPRRRTSPKQAAARRRFATFIKKHGRPPRKGEHL